MAKDKRIGELPGISAAATVGLNRIGIVTIYDLLSAEFDRVAYIVDDYNEAARLVREAKKLADPNQSRQGRKGGASEGHVPAPLSGTPPPSNNRAQLRAGSQPPTQQTPAPASGALGQAMAALGLGLSLSGESAQRDRAALARRLSVAAMLVDEGASEAELITSAILECVESGALPAEDAAPRYGKPVESLLEECTAMRAVPMLPTGKPPRYYLDMAKSASRESRRICAAHLLATLQDGPGSLPGGAWYAKLLLEGLEAAGPDNLVAEARAALDGAQRRAA